MWSPAVRVRTCESSAISHYFRCVFFSCLVIFYKSLGQIVHVGWTKIYYMSVPIGFCPISLRDIVRDG